MIVGFIIFAIAAIFQIIFSVRDGNQELEQFKTLPINSRVYGLRNIKRGNYEIKLLHNNSLLVFNLPIADDVEEFKIETGDSLTKESNSGICNLYRNRDSIPRLIGTLTIY